MAWLCGAVFEDGTFHWSMLVVHYIVPIAMILDWLLFDAKGTMGKGEPPTWLVFPLATVFLALGYVYLLIDHLMGKRVESSAQK